MDPDLETTARALVMPDKGILAADESFPTIEKRFEPIGVPSTPDTRRAYREMLLGAHGAELYISGVILFDETFLQSAEDGTSFPALLERMTIIPGIKVDRGAKPLALAPGETVTEGLDGLRERLQEYRAGGARFTKWRAVFTIGTDIPSDVGIATNAHALGRFAALSQEAGLVPIVEPEVLMDGTHSIGDSAAVTGHVIDAVFAELRAQRVRLEGMLLKPNMILAGYQAPVQASVDEVAEATIGCLRRSVPAAVPGIVFLSGGQSDEDATARLSAMNARGPHPWQLSFSYGRALQDAPLRAWAGRAENVAAAQAAYLHRARMNSLARSGLYRPELERDAAPATAAR